MPEFKVTIAAMGAAAALALGFPAIAAEPTITAEVQSTPQKALTPAERRALSIAGGRLINHAYEARQAIAAKDKEKTLKNVDKALVLADIIEAAAPTYKVKATIKAGDKVYNDEATVQQRIVPIFNELNRVLLEAPLSEVREQAKKERSATEPVIASTAIEELRVDLDVPRAKANLMAAKKELQQGQLEAADLALVGAEKSVILSVSVAELPLERVRDNLMLASNNVADADFQGARVALAAAADDLKRFAETATKEAGDKARDLANKIAALSGQVDKDAKEARTKILNYWEQVGTLIKR